MIQRITILGLLMALTISITAQTERTNNQTEGVITIRQDQQMEQILYRAKNSGNSTPDFITAAGFRVQVYSGNHPQKAREDAMSIDKTIKDQYPEYRAYVSFNAPFWRVRIGDFTNYFEALLLSRELKKIFPDFSDEIYVVRDPAVRILYF